MKQAKFFAEQESDARLPKGMHYGRELISQAQEKALAARLDELPFKEFEFHGFKGKRRTVSFGWHYEFSGRGSLKKANDIPEFLLPLREVAAKFAETEPEELQHVLAIQYGPGAGIGWHRDKPVFGEVIGVSLLAPCVLRFRRKKSHGRLPSIKSKKLQGVEKVTWERVNLLAERRSAYHLTGPARLEWQHSILSVDAFRYSITFRTLRG